jgi:hypothetical protein
LNSAQEAVKIQPECEAEESPLLKSMAREGLIKTQQAGKA